MFEFIFGSGQAFHPDQLPDLSGKVVIVTGASAGLGKESTIVLAKKGAQVIMACRSVSKAEGVVGEIKKIVPDAKLEVMEMDLSSLASVKKFAENFKAKRLPIHILMNNAGGILPVYSETKDGIESQFGQNHVGPFYLTSLLLPIIEETAKSAPVRIVNLASAAHLYASKGIDYNINNSASFSSFGNYARSKLANIMFTTELQRKLEAKGQNNIYVNAVHPGAVMTEFVRPETVGSLAPYIKPVLGLFFYTSPQGAYTQLYAAASPEVVEKGYKGKYFVPQAQVGESNAAGKDSEAARKLWEFTDELIKEKGF
ncbi:hypothetical protein HK101_005354 [Irineochytrium annulatum]|nr:hypothetical protein HK101_005354 [Irineochytrium annulatum]